MSRLFEERRIAKYSRENRYVGNNVLANIELVNIGIRMSRVASLTKLGKVIGK